MEQSGEHEWREYQPPSDASFYDGIHALGNPHYESLDNKSGQDEIVNPATGPYGTDDELSIVNGVVLPQPDVLAPHDATATPYTICTAGALSIYGTEAAPAPLPVLLQRLAPSEKPDILHQSESAWLPPNETVSPEMADGMFGVLAGGPEAVITDEDRERVHRLYQTGVLEWAGSGIIPPALDRLFGEKDAASGETQPSQAALRDIVNRQLSDLVGTLGDIEDGIRATDVLRLTTFRDATRPVIASEAVPETGPGEGYEAGQFRITVQDGIVNVAEQLVPQAAHRPPALLGYAYSDSEVRLVNPNSFERYRVTSQDGYPHVIHDTLRSLESGDSPYFTALARMLSNHKGLLIRVVSDAGVDLVTQFDIASGTVHRDAGARQEVNDKMGNLIASNGPAADLRTELMASAAGIYLHLRTTHTFNDKTRRIEESGMRAVVTRTTDYYGAIVPRPVPAD